MTQSTALIAAIKRGLKANGLTYRDVALRLKVSEATVKRMFSGRSSGSLTLRRLDQLCALLGVDVVELVHRAEAGKSELTELSEQQEQEIVSDPKLLVVAFLVVNGWSADDIAKEYALTKNQLVRCLARLDKLRLIELLPNNLIRLLIAPRFGWRKNGPIEQFVVGNLLHEFMRSRFSRPDEVLSFQSGMFTRSSMLKLSQRLEQLPVEFAELNDADRHVSYARRTGYTLLVAMRPWRSDIFERMKK